MKLTTILKGVLGLALIYFVCLPICTLGKAMETNKSAELSQKIEVEKAPKAVKFSPAERIRFSPPEENIGKVFIDGYFNIKDGKLLDRKAGWLKY